MKKAGRPSCLARGQTARSQGQRLHEGKNMGALLTKVASTTHVFSGAKGDDDKSKA